MHKVTPLFLKAKHTHTHTHNQQQKTFGIKMKNENIPHCRSSSKIYIINTY